jgi:hypothetical protein
VVRYPHTLELTWQEDGRFSATTGDFVEGEEHTETIEGRAEANGKGSLVGLQDGSQIVYNYTFYCQPQDEVPFGAKAELYDGTTLRHTGTVKRMASAQKHCLIWL